MLGNSFKMIELGDNYVWSPPADSTGPMCPSSRRPSKVTEDY